MATQDTVPRGFRASDEDRENVIELLRDGSVKGRLSHDTFLQRVDSALHARRLDELAGLVSDLPPAAIATGWLDRAAGWCSALGERAQAAWRTPRLPVLVLPREDRVYLIGRDPSCDLAIRNSTVSWHHAELRRTADGWVLADLGSTNGTRVNRWRVGGGFPVRPGDCVSFGRAGYRLAG